MKRSLGLSILIIIIFTLVFAMSGSTRNMDKIKFNHTLHVEDMELECDSCHETVAESKLSDDLNMPEKDVCLGCHDGDTASEECETCHTDTEDPQPYVKTERMYFFSHNLHLETGGFECKVCHNPEDETKPYASLLNMDGCWACHEDEYEGRTCMTCHKNKNSTVPADHAGNWELIHDDMARSGSSSCNACHLDDYCNKCHYNSDLVIEKDFSLYTNAPLRPKGGVQGRTHDLNYRYLHGIEARTREMDCNVCHSSGDFCSRCHESVKAGESGKPSWHSALNWGALANAVGTGGGNHARFAKRNIEICAACHDNQGNDPVCIMCHTDRAPGKGNDPKTHKANFYKNIRGEWHDDDSSVCFNCHSKNINAQIGFCKYCHN
ncbi:cytochrome c3 family protein [candidate division KSB1 bacterium]